MDNSLVILVILVISVISVILVNKSSFKEVDNFIAVTYENESKNKNTHNLIKMFKKNNFKYEVLGNGYSWSGWYGRLREYLNYLQRLDPETYVLVCDGRDVLINEDYSTFIKKAKIEYSLNKNKIIIGTEPGCCTPLNKGKYYPNNPKNKNIPVPFFPTIQSNNIIKLYTEYMDSKSSNSSFPYLNFGLLFGKAKDLANLFLLMKIEPGDDDQSLVYKIYYEHPELLNPDYNQLIFSNAAHLNTAHIPDNMKNQPLCFYKWNGKKFENTITNSTPSIIQTPGKNWDCYNELLTKLL